MIDRTLFLLATVFALNLSAKADSWCGFEAGLVGTTAIGYVMPWELLPNNTEGNPYTDEVAVTCSVSSYATSDPSQATVNTRSCNEFEFVPSRYVPEDEENPGASPYFAFLVYSAQHNMAEVRLQTGQPLWVRHNRSYSFKFAANDNISHGHGTIHLPSFEGAPTETTIHLSPSFDDETEPFVDLLKQDPSLFERNSNIQKFFNDPVFGLLDALSLYDPSQKRAYLETPSWETQFETSYNGIRLLEDENGFQWLEAEEVLVQHTLWQVNHLDVDGLDVSDEEKQRLKALAYTSAISDPLRTVYFPYRSPDGTILMVLTQGVACD